MSRYFSELIISMQI